VLFDFVSKVSKVSQVFTSKCGPIAMSSSPRSSSFVLSTKMGLVRGICQIPTACSIAVL